MYSLFVYGTLMRGYGNNVLLSDSQFIGEAVTVDAKFNMATGGFPITYADGSAKVKGELYLIDDKALIRCDRLEGHPDWYRREVADVQLLSSDDVGAAFMYIMPGAARGHLLAPDESNVISWRRGYGRGRAA